MSFVREFTLSADKVQAFADLVGDHNPVHLDPEFAAATPFKQPICHGMLVAGLFSGCLVERFGAGTIYLEQQILFQRPVPVGATVRVVLGDPQQQEKGRLSVPTTVEIQRGSVWKKVVDGNAVVQPGATF